MNLTEIKKINEKISMQSKEMKFFKNLYHNCMTALEMVPDDFIYKVFEEAYLNKRVVGNICFSKDEKTENTYVTFDILNESNGNSSQEVFVVEGIKFDFCQFSMVIDLINKSMENTVCFLNINSGKFSIYDAKRVFGKYFIKTDDSWDSFAVSTKCFD